jgi:hypothetical protein
MPFVKAARQEIPIKNNPCRSHPVILDRRFFPRKGFTALRAQIIFIDKERPLHLPADHRAETLFRMERTRT